MPVGIGHILSTKFHQFSFRPSRDRGIILLTMLKPEQSQKGFRDAHTSSHPKNDESHGVLLDQQSRFITSFYLAPPPPTSLPRILRSRPRLLLQLQQIDHTARPEPVLDVVQTSGFGLRLDKIISAAFRGKGAVGHCHPRAGLNDSYARIEVIGHDSAKARKDGCNEDGEVIATICQAQEEARRNGNGRVILRFGPSWDASHHPNGRYEFVAANESVQNRIVEWMPCEKGSRSMSAASLPLGPVADQDKRFIFCVIDPITGHRSAIASMTRRSIDVIDRYSDVSRTRSNQFLRPDGALSDTSEGNSAPGLNVKAIGDDLQLVLLITGICVALWEGWLEKRSNLF